MRLTNLLGWTLLHFLWQGTLIALLLATGRGFLRRRPANARYAAACGAMLLMVVCALSTFLWLDAGSAVSSGSVVRARLDMDPAAVKAAPVLPGGAPGADLFSQYLPLLVYVWFAGVCALAVRSAGAWVVVQRFRRMSSRPVDSLWQERLAKLAEQLKISRTVRLCESALAEVPAVVGCLRPVVLLPASALTGLTPGQLEALLAHELAHIRRHDYLINLLQTAVETLLFYHPAVWWVGRQMRAERENCCDDLAVRVSGDVLVYARALSRMEELRRETPALAMAADGGSLLRRIRRLVRPGEPETAASADWVTAIAVMFCGLAVWAAPHLRLSRVLPPVQAQTAVYRTSTPEPRDRGALFVTGGRAERRILLRRVMAQAAAAPEPTEEAQPEPANGSGHDFIGGLASAGYRGLSVDELISLKQHGVTPEYIAALKSAGFSPTVQQLIAFKIHGAEPGGIRAMQALGYKLTVDEVIAMQIHGVTAESARQIKGLGLGDPSFEQLVAMQIHGVTPEFAAGMKQAGLHDLSLGRLIALRIHGAEVSTVTEIKALGFPDVSTDDIERLCIFGVTPEYIRKARQHGFKDLSLEQLIKLKQFGILD